MSLDITWVLASVTVLVLVCYEIGLIFAQRRFPEHLARTAHAKLREQWFTALAQQKGSEILAVQTLRNSVMSATMTASTAVLGLMGTVTLAAPSLDTAFGGQSMALHLSAHLALELVLFVLLFAALISSAMAIRYYNLAGFVAAMPVDSGSRRRWTAAGAAYLRRAGLLYSWALHHLILVAPIVAAILYPAAGPVAALIIVAALLRFDRAHEQDTI